MNIIKFEVRHNLKSTLIWSIVVSLVAIMYIAMSPLFVDQADTLMGFMESLGENFMNGLGIDFDNFFTPVGFFSYVGGYIFTALGVQALIYGIKAFVLEKNQKSIEFIYTKPGSRTKLFASKWISGLILLTITQLIVISAIVISTDALNSAEYDHHLMLLEAAALIPIQYLFYTFGILIGVSVNRLKNVVSFAVVFALVMFILNTLAAMLESELLAKLSLLNYYNLSDIVADKGYDTTNVLISVVIIVVTTIIALVIYKYRDLKST